MNIIQSGRRKSCHLQQHGWTLRALCYMKSGKQRKTNAIRYHLHVESRKAKVTETESRMVVIRGLGVGEIDVNGTNFQLEDKF